MDLFALDVNIQTPCTIALGYFDGVHLGHRAVIERAVSEAKKRGCRSAVFSFVDKEKKCSKKAARGEIFDRERCCEIIKELGVDFVIMPDFSEFCELSPQQFVSLLCKKLCAVALYCGEDYRFGKNAEGNVQMLASISKEVGIELFVTEKVMLDGAPVSSTRICEALRNGKPELAEKLLGRPYSLKAQVVNGKHIGSAQLYPTVNQRFGEDSVIPKNGVYVSRVKYAGEILPAVTNIGVCPTVQSGQTIPVAETYIIDKQIQLYGKTVEVELKHFLRQEKKFESVEALKAQISADIEAAKTI